MVIILFSLWMILSGKATPEIIITGLVLTALIELFLIKFMGYTIKQEIRAFRLLPDILKYLWLLIKEIFKASWAVIKLVFSPRLEVEPQLTNFDTSLTSRPGKTALANSITLTPGTITISVEGERFTVHALDSTLAEGIDNTEFEQKLKKMEAKAK